jgi:hypothetical protein
MSILLKQKTKYNVVRTVPNSNRKIAQWSKIDTHNLRIHDSSLFCLGTGTSRTIGES